MIAARILETPEDWARYFVTLMVRRERSVLMADGSWYTPKEGEALPEGAGLRLPRDVVEAIAQAIAEWQGHTSHADTEARVLREWLAAEKERVDGIIFSATDRVRRPMRRETDEG